MLLDARTSTLSASRRLQCGLQMLCFVQSKKRKRKRRSCDESYDILKKNIQYVSRNTNPVCLIFCVYLTNWHDTMLVFMSAGKKLQ